MIYDERDMDQLITRWLQEAGETPRASYVAETLERLDRTQQRRLAGSLRGALPIERPILPRAPRTAQVAFVLLLLLLALAISLVVVGSQRRSTPPIGPAGNGAIAYASEDGVTFLALDGSRTTTRLRGIGIDNNVAFSPDGTDIAFLSRKPGTESGEGSEQLFVAAVEGDAPARNVSGPLPVWNLSIWSTDDSQLAPAWSPDGTRLAYTGFDLDANRVVIAIANVDGRPPTAILPDDDRVDYTHPQWSPDGRWLTVRAHSYEPGVNGPGDFGVRLVLMRSDGTEQREVTYTPIRTGSFARVAWAPDSSQFAYARQDTPAMGEYDVVRYDLGTATETAVNPPQTRADDPAWSPDGQWIAYHEALGPETVSRVVITDATDAARPRRDLGPVVACSLEWSPDGGYLLGYAAGCEGELRVVPVDDPSHAISLPAPGATGMVSWQRVPPAAAKTP